MEHPHDRSDFEPSLAATLAVLRREAPAPSPNEEMLEAAQSVSAPLAAFAHTLGSYLPGPELAHLETDAMLTDNDLDEWAGPLQRAGVKLSDCLLIGVDGGGVEHLFMAADDGDAGYALYLWDMEGERYEHSDAPLWRVGTFAALFAYLIDAGREELDPALAAIAK